MTAQNLADGLTRMNLVLPVETQQKLLDYLALVQKWNKVYNLTAVRDSDKMLTLHLLDSLAVVPHVSDATTLLDVGSGAGLPGVPLALALPHVQVTLLDSNQKKVTFLNQVIIELKLHNVVTICERVEKYQQKQLFSVIVSRAFSRLPDFIALAGHLLAPGGTLLAMKGANPASEIADVPEGFKLGGVTPLTIPGLDAERHLVFLKAA